MDNGGGTHAKALHLGGQAVGDDENDWVVVTVLLEESGEGSEVAGPVAREIVDHVLQGASL